MKLNATMVSNQTGLEAYAKQGAVSGGVSNFKDLTFDSTSVDMQGQTLNNITRLGDSTGNPFLYPNATLITSGGINVTDKAINSLQDTADVIKDTHIDWGSGVNQVNLADVPASDYDMQGYKITNTTKFGGYTLKVELNGATAELYYNNGTLINSSTNHSEILNDVVNYLPDRGGTVIFGTGTFDFSNGGVNWTKDRIRLIGMGSEATQFNFYPANDGVNRTLFEFNTGLTSGGFVEISGIFFNSNENSENPPDPNNIAIDIRLIAFTSIHDCQIKGFGTGIRIMNNSQYTKIYNNQIFGVQWGVKILGATNGMSNAGSINGNSFAQSGPYARPIMIYCEGNGWNIYNNWIETGAGCARYFVEIVGYDDGTYTGGKFNRIYSNTFSSQCAEALIMLTGTKDTKIFGNEFAKCNTSIAFNGSMSYGTNIIDNKFENWQVGAIYLDMAESTKILFNNFTDQAGVGNILTTTGNTGTKMVGWNDGYANQYFNTPSNCAGQTVTDVDITDDGQITLTCEADDTGGGGMNDSKELYEGILLYLGLDSGGRGNSTAAFDSSNNAIDGVMIDDIDWDIPVWVDSQILTGLEFHNATGGGGLVDDAILLGSPAELNFGGTNKPFTVCAGFSWTGYTGVINSQYIIDDGQEWLLLFHSGTGNWRFYIKNSTGTWFYDQLSASGDENKYTVLCGRFDGRYLELCRNATCTGTPGDIGAGNTIYDSLSNTVIVGNDYDSASGFNGTLDWLIIYDKYLTQNELDLIYKGYLPQATGHLKLKT
jgi:hypothetical protein